MGICVPGISGGPPMTVDTQSAKSELNCVCLAGKNSVLGTQTTDEITLGLPGWRHRCRGAREGLRTINAVEVLNRNGDTL